MTKPIKQKMTEFDVQMMLGQHLLLKSHSFVIPNKCLKYECDLISFNLSEYLNEFEIKVTRADFKHERVKERKHKWLVTGKPAKNKPNYFWFATPFDLIQPEEINPLYGLIYVSDKTIKIIKRPKLLHKTKHLDMKMMKSLTRAMSFKIFNRFGENLV
jgi:hypothetical protein